MLQIGKFLKKLISHRKEFMKLYLAKIFLSLQGLSANEDQKVEISSEILFNRK